MEASYRAVHENQEASRNFNIHGCVMDIFNSHFCVNIFIFTTNTTVETIRNHGMTIGVHTENGGSKPPLANF
jgi:hypothetical protein